MSREILPVIIFGIILILAIMLGNWFLTFILQRPLESVPTFLKTIVHAVSLVIVIVAGKKYFVK